MTRFNTSQPLLLQLRQCGLEFDQKLTRALEISASTPAVYPEDTGFPDSYLTLALYRLNSVLSQIVRLDDTQFNLFQEYRGAPRCSPSVVVPGRRLCNVLEIAATLAGDSKTIGVGHFLRAIVQLTLDTKAEPAYGFEPNVSHNTFSAELFTVGLGHSAWTPVHEVPELRNILQSLDARHPIDDFQYLLTLEDKRLVFRPTSILDDYSMAGRDDSETERRAILTHFRDQYAGVTPDELLELEDLINNRQTVEVDFQRFFEAHPQFLRIWDYREVFPQIYLTREDQGPLVPDFLLVDGEMNRATLVDLKLPSARTVVAKKNRERFSALVQEARSQLLEYRDWFDDPTNRERMKTEHGVEVYRPRLGVVIGSSKDFSSSLQRQKLASRSPDIELVTYDDILIHARRRLSLVRSATLGPRGPHA